MVSNCMLHSIFARMPKSKLYILGLVTLLIFPLVGITIVGVFEEDPWAFSWSMHMAWWKQLAIGSAFGLLSGWFAWSLISMEFMKPVVLKYQPLIQSLRLNNVDLVFMSLCAGIGEEVLFRGVLQSYWGIWITAVVFVAIHGYLDPRDKKMSIYGASLTLVIAGMGYLTDYVGLVAAMSAHAVLDIILFYKLTRYKNHEVNSLDQHL